MRAAKRLHRATPGAVGTAVGGACMELAVDIKVGGRVWPNLPFTQAVDMIEAYDRDAVQVVISVAGQTSPAVTMAVR